MSKVIEKKILSEYFDSVATSNKTFELRLADWDCQPGDILILNEVDSETKKPTGRSLKRTVGYVGKTKEFDFWTKEEIDKHGYQIISLLDESKIKLYRFSPIKTDAEFLWALNYVHCATSNLCKKIYGEYLPNLGNIVIFCHYNSEFEFLNSKRKNITVEDGNIEGKYFNLKTPISMVSSDEIPDVTFKYLYIRQPDPWRSQVGDVDFYLEQLKYNELKQQIKAVRANKGMRLFPRDDLDMIEIFDPDIDALAYIRPERI
jgi:hypothetical protein